MPGKQNSIRTSKSTAKVASKVLRDGRFSDAAKTAAGGALVNRKESTKGKSKKS